MLASLLQTALQKGLVDQIGTFENAVDEAKKLAGSSTLITISSITRMVVLCGLCRSSLSCAKTKTASMSYDRT